MRDLVRFGLVAALVLVASGCPEDGVQQDGLAAEDPDRDARVDEDSPLGPDAGDPGGDDDEGASRDGGTSVDAGAMEQDDGPGVDAGVDAGMTPAPNRPPADSPEDPDDMPTPRTVVPDELVGAWQSSPIDFALWENYREGYWASRNAVPTREAMVFHENGDAKFYRYEFVLTAYEELIDCEGTVAFHDDGTFTFYPVEGRKRFYDTNSSINNVDRALTAEELLDPELAGTRAYTYDPSKPSALLITVPSSAPYYWYKKE